MAALVHHFGPPTDPAYIAFRDGLLKANDDLTDRWRWRWSSQHTGWFNYPTKDWILDDVGIADTPAGSAFDLIRDDEPEVERARADTCLPDVFAQVQSAYARQQTQRPGLVWTWLGGGDWRVAIYRKDVTHQGPGSSDQGGSAGHGPLNAECQRRVADVRAWIANGTITAAQGQRLIAQIVEECTLGPRAG